MDRSIADTLRKIWDGYVPTIGSFLEKLWMFNFGDITWGEASVALVTVGVVGFVINSIFENSAQ